MLEYICIITSMRGDPDKKFVVNYELFDTYEKACDYGKKMRELEKPYLADWFVYRGYEWR